MAREQVGQVVQGRQHAGDLAGMVEQGGVGRGGWNMVAGRPDLSGYKSGLGKLP